MSLVWAAALTTCKAQVLGEPARSAKPQMDNSRGTLGKGQYWEDPDPEEVACEEEREECSEPGYLKTQPFSCP